MAGLGTIYRGKNTPKKVKDTTTSYPSGKEQLESLTNETISPQLTAVNINARENSDGGTYHRKHLGHVLLCEGFGGRFDRLDLFEEWRTDKDGKEGNHQFKLWYRKCRLTKTGEHVGRLRLKEELKLTMNEAVSLIGFVAEVHPPEEIDKFIRMMEHIKSEKLS